MAERLARALAKLPEVRLLFPRQANAVFADLPLDVIEPLRKDWLFYTFIGRGGSRLMCAWDTTEEDVDCFVADLARLLSGDRSVVTEPRTGRKL
jgi:threonine aldolase